MAVEAAGIERHLTARRRAQQERGNVGTGESIRNLEVPLRELRREIVAARTRSGVVCRGLQHHELHPGVQCMTPLRPCQRADPAVVRGDRVIAWSTSQSSCNREARERLYGQTCHKRWREAQLCRIEAEAVAHCRTLPAREAVPNVQDRSRSEYIHVIQTDATVDPRRELAGRDVAERVADGFLPVIPAQCGEYLVAIAELMINARHRRVDRVLRWDVRDIVHTPGRLRRARWQVRQRNILQAHCERSD